MKLRPSRRHPQNNSSGLYQGSTTPSASRSQDSETAATSSDHNNNNSVEPNINNNNNIQEDNNPVQRKPSTAVRKVFHILASPQRALRKSTSKRKQENAFTPTPTPTPSPRDGFPQVIINRNNRMYSKMNDTSCDYNAMNHEMEIEFQDSNYTTNVNTTNTRTRTSDKGVKTRESSPLPPQNIMHWLHDEAPQDIMPKVFSFVGPQTLQILSRVSKNWRKLCLAEGVFQTLCEDYGKLPNTHNDDGDQLMAEGDHFWREFYCNNPIVPLDYPTIRQAVDATGTYSERKQIYEYRKNVRVLLYPGIHLLENSVRVHTYGDSVFAVETLQQNLCDGNYSDTGNYLALRPRSFSGGAEEDSTSLGSTSRRRLHSRNNFRNIFSCRSTSSTSDTFEDSNNGSGSPASFSSFNEVSHSKVLEKAVVLIKTKKQNLPVFHVTQGTMKISNLNIIHNCSGIDIWNGNTAVQSQPQFFDNRPVIPQNSDKMPHAIIENSSLTSISGRGIVAIDGGIVSVRKCRILDCAATGLYVGGPGSAATVEDSDIIRNGNGNERSRRGIARGHSGVYLEQGVAVLKSCNVSKNSLTGISAISQTNAKLTVKDSDLVGNGTEQLEMPPAGSVSRQQSLSVNNNISTEGEGRSRSGLDLEEDNGGEQLGRALEDVARRTFLSTARSGGGVTNPPPIPLF